jgi:hypothetical protein
VRRPWIPCNSYPTVDNNAYGDEMKTRLESIRYSQEREGYILMDKICPPTQKGAILPIGTEEPLIFDNLFCEVGIFGVYVR